MIAKISQKAEGRPCSENNVVKVDKSDVGIENEHLQHNMDY